MALGNVIGSNIFNLLLVLGVAGTVSNTFAKYGARSVLLVAFTCFLHN